MARGINRAARTFNASAQATHSTKAFTGSTSKPCVFISYHHEDESACQKIADYLINAEIDVYFDKYDKTLSQLVNEGNADKVTKRIQDGIDFSSHMLCVVSITTVKSYWVPFEVGYGYPKIALGIMTLKGVEESSLPEYMKTTKVIRGTKSLNDFISGLLSQSVDSLSIKGLIRKASEQQHPLDEVLDWNK